MRKRYGIMSVFVALLAVSAMAFGSGLRFKAALSTAQEVPTPTSGNITKARLEAGFDEAFTQVKVRLEVEGGENVVAAHLH